MNVNSVFTIGLRVIFPFIGTPILLAILASRLYNQVKTNPLLPLNVDQRKRFLAFMVGIIAAALVIMAEIFPSHVVCVVTCGYKAFTLNTPVIVAHVGVGLALGAGLVAVTRLLPNSIYQLLAIACISCACLVGLYLDFFSPYAESVMWLTFSAVGGGLVYAMIDPARPVGRGAGGSGAYSPPPGPIF